MGAALSSRRRTFGIKIHDRLTPEDQHLATVMYTPHDSSEGPWYDIVTCDTDWAWEILNALQFTEEHDCECE
jgi:hypothetical protein